MIDLDELMRLREAATPGPWKKMLPTVIVTDNPQSSYIIPVCTVLHDNHAQAENDAAYIVAACNAVPELVARIRKLESEIKRRDAQRWADLCNDCESDGSCPYLVTCPFDEKKCGDVRPADWLKWMEEKK